MIQNDVEYVLQNDDVVTYRENDCVVTQKEELETRGAYRSRRLGQRIVTVYMYFLNESPLITKCLTAATIGGLGDLSAQYTEHRLNVAWSDIYYPFQVDFMRQIGVMIEAGFVSGPIMHYAFDLMEAWFPVHGDHHDRDLKTPDNATTSIQLKKWCAALTHLLLEQLLLCPIFVFSMMVFTAVMEGEVNSLSYELRYEFLGTYYTATVASLTFAPLQLLAFRLLPINLRLLYMNVQDVFWNAIVSFMTHRSRH
jgi:protein Mpv17